MSTASLETILDLGAVHGGANPTMRFDHIIERPGGGAPGTTGIPIRHLPPCPTGTPRVGGPVYPPGSTCGTGTLGGFGTTAGFNGYGNCGGANGYGYGYGGFNGFNGFCGQ